MKVLIFNGSPHEDGNTARAIKELVSEFDKNGVETEVIQIGGRVIAGCTGCRGCYKLGKCVIDGDIVNETAPKLAEADGVIIASPVYYASAPGPLVTFMDRLFYSSRGSIDKTMKVGACAVVARRGGLSATFDELNKYFTISAMPVASSNYWNSVHGRVFGDAEQDCEGMQTMRVLAENMTFLMKSIALGKEAYGIPVNEKKTNMNFIR